MENRMDCFMLYPVHIDSSRSLGDGRRYSKETAIHKPSFKEIRSALDTLKLNFKEEESKRHPKDQQEKGRVVINKPYNRKIIIQRIVECIKENREKKAQDELKTKHGNFLNLVPISRKKSKKK